MPDASRFFEDQLRCLPALGVAYWGDRKSNSTTGSKMFATAYPAHPLLVSEERQKNFPFFADEAKESSSCILFAFFQKSVTEHDCLDWCVLNFGISFCDCHALDIECHVFDCRIALSQSHQAVDRHSSSSGSGP